MTILNFCGGACVGGDGPSYHWARLRFASIGLRPIPSAMRLKSRREKSDAAAGGGDRARRPHAAIYRDIAARVRDQLMDQPARVAPKIVIES